MHLCWYQWGEIRLIGVALVLWQLLGDGALATDEAFSSGKCTLRWTLCVGLQGLWVMVLWLLIS